MLDIVICYVINVSRLDSENLCEARLSCQFEDHIHMVSILKSHGEPIRVHCRIRAMYKVRHFKYLTYNLFCVFYIWYVTFEHENHLFDILCFHGIGSVKNAHKLQKKNEHMCYFS